MNTIIKITMFKKLLNEREEMEKKLEELKSSMIEDMHGEEVVQFGQYKAQNKTITRKGIDNKKLKELFPEAAEACKTETQYKRFTV